MTGPASRDMPQLTALNTKAQDNVWSLISQQFLLNTITPAAAITPATDSGWLIMRSPPGPTAVLQRTVCSQTEHRLATNYSGVIYSKPEHHHSTHSVFTDRAHSGNKPQWGDVFTARTPSYNTQCVHNQNTILQHAMCSQAEHHPTTHSMFTTRTPPCNTQCVHNQNTILQHIVCSQSTERVLFGNKCVHSQNIILQHTVCSQPEHHPTRHSVFTGRTPS